ncbi:MAG: hypothetical protein Q7T11_07805 [Deltaproteobacteria bacterium]|nr:hypothetical protein [Deltaproteobacteria bacterium]
MNKKLKERTITMRKTLSVFVFTLVLAAGNAGAKTANEGPEIKVPEEEMASDDEGLKRLGDFGKFHLFGYGELHYNNPIGLDTDQMDFHRLVLGLGYDFTDWLEFRGELDFEHAFTEPELEYAYLDFLIKDYFNVRAGSILVPMGVINQHHEPPLFFSVERPEVYRVIIPTSWQEGGAGIFGKFWNGFEYELYGMSSLNAMGFTGTNGLRAGRGHVAEAPTKDFAGAGRLQYTGVPGLRIGTSAFVGNTGQGNDTIDGGFLTLIEGDAKYSFQGIDLEGLVAYASLTDAGNINTARVAADPTFTNFVGSSMLGWYVEGAYHLFHHLMPDTKHDLVAFGRYEDFNTQQSMPSGFAGSDANNRNTLTVGLSYLPIPQVAIKTDYMFNWNAANAGNDQFNVGIGFYY